VPAIHAACPHCTATLSLCHKKDIDRISNVTATILRPSSCKKDVASVSTDWTQALDGDRYELVPSCQLCVLFHLSPLSFVCDFAWSSDCPIHMADCEFIGTREVPRHTFSTGPWHCRHFIRPFVVCVRQFGRLQSRRNLRRQQSAADQLIDTQRVRSRSGLYVQKKLSTESIINSSTALRRARRPTGLRQMRPLPHKCSFYLFCDPSFGKHSSADFRPNP
jgi:hypothetical protein